MLEPCPKCGWAFLTEKITKRHGRQLICANEACDYVRSAELEEAGGCPPEFRAAAVSIG